MEAVNLIKFGDSIIQALRSRLRLKDLPKVQAYFLEYKKFILMISCSS